MAANGLSISAADMLRAATRDLHEQIETNPLHSAIVNGSATRASYCRLLAKMYGFHKGFETLAAGYREWDQLGFDFQSRSKLNALGSDLAAMGWQGVADELPPLSLPLQQASFAFVTGYLYVSEGSTLGGQVLMKHLATQLEVSRDNGGAYFSSYGSRVAEKWKECREFLARVGTSSDQAAGEMVAGARDAFLRLDAWLR